MENSFCHCPPCLPLVPPQGPWVLGILGPPCDPVTKGAMPDLGHKKRLGLWWPRELIGALAVPCLLPLPVGQAMVPFSPSGDLSSLSLISRCTRKVPVLEEAKGMGTEGNIFCRSCWYLMGSLTSSASAGSRQRFRFPLQGAGKRKNE